uniref:Serpentine Receptor, class J n=1 Tax=Panagrellus redivivus TaxID=6233 RepID=A0A7E5A256_PANRE
MEPHIPYLALCLYSTSFCLNWIAVLRLGYVFFGARIRACIKLSKVVKPEFSIHFRIYLTAVFIVSIINIIYASYFITQWSPANKYTFFWIYIFGFMAQSTTPTIPVTVFGLMINRILIIQRRFEFFNNKVLPKITICAVFVVFGVSVSLFVPQFPKDGTLKVCWAFFCVVGIHASNFYTYVKLSFGLFNAILSVYFYAIIKHQAKKFDSNNNRASQAWGKHYKKANHLTIMTGVFECLFNFIPHTIDGFIIRLMDFDVTAYVGPYSTFLTSVDALMVAHAYANTLTSKIEKSISTVHVKPVNGSTK